ncbi:MAG: hypothetical protein L3J89_10365 [Gammaproteobacteria bacterium]|nr:hypothetical protein [Gammaproteobacteria bacterium]
MRSLLLICCALLTMNAMAADDTRAKLLAFNPLNGTLESSRSFTTVESAFNKDNHCVLVSKSTTFAKADKAFENENVMTVDFTNIPIQEMYAAHRDGGSWLNVKYQVHATLTRSLIHYNVTSASMPGMVYERDDDYFIFMFNELEEVTQAQQLLIDIITECQK